MWRIWAYVVRQQKQKLLFALYRYSFIFSKFCVYGSAEPPRSFVEYINDNRSNLKLRLVSDCAPPQSYVNVLFLLWRWCSSQFSCCCIYILVFCSIAWSCGAVATGHHRTTRRRLPPQRLWIYKDFNLYWWWVSEWVTFGIKDEWRDDE